MSQRLSLAKQSPQLTRKLFRAGSDDQGERAGGRPARPGEHPRIADQTAAHSGTDMHVKEAKIHGERELRVTTCPSGASRRCSRRGSVRRWSGRGRDADRRPRRERRSLRARPRALLREGLSDLLPSRSRRLNFWNRLNVSFQTLRDRPTRCSASPGGLSDRNHAAQEEARTR